MSAYLWQSSVPATLTAEFTSFATIMVFIILKKNIFAGHGSHGSVIPSLGGGWGSRGKNIKSSKSFSLWIGGQPGLQETLLKNGKLRLRIQIPSILTELLYPYLAASSSKPCPHAYAVE